MRVVNLCLEQALRSLFKYQLLYFLSPFFLGSMELARVPYATLQDNLPASGPDKSPVIHEQLLY